MQLTSPCKGLQGGRLPARRAIAGNLRHLTTRASASQKADQGIVSAQFMLGTYPTELLRLQATNTPVVQLLVVGGNPGLAAFYCQFMRELQAAFGGAADVLAVSHVGHDSQALSAGRLWGLDSQIQHKVQLLHELLAPGKAPTVILAHSIGSYIMLQALRQLQANSRHAAGGGLQDICKVFLLMPFLATHWQSWEQRLLAAAAQHHAERLSSALGSLQGGPGWLQDHVVHLLLPGAERHAADSLRCALNPHSLRNNWHLAAQEFRVLDAPVDWSLIEGLGDRAAVVYNPSDPWFQQYDALQQHLPGIEVHARQDLGHAFCCSTAESRSVARLVAASVLGPADAGRAWGPGHSTALQRPRLQGALGGT